MGAGWGYVRFLSDGDDALTPLRIAVLATCLLLCACVTTDKATEWQPRTDANLATDLAVCEKDAREVNMQSPGGYSDGRYGAAAALASAIDRKDMRGGGAERVYQAVLDICMTRKGWKRAG
jgi:hypothetical protein